jgi:hypothetical protein
MFAISLIQGLAYFLGTTNPATFWAHIIQAAVDSTGVLFDAILKFRLSKSQPYLIRLLSTTRTLIQALPRGTKALQPHIFRLIGARIRHDPDLTWNEIDAQLVSILDLAFQDTVLTGEYLEGGTLAVANMITADTEQNVRTHLNFILALF